MNNLEFPSFDAVGIRPPYQWALLQRRLIDNMNKAALEHVARYTREDGTLIWRKEWPGMDGSDDAYESFYNFPLLYSLGGSEEVYEQAVREWDAITWQWTEYGQIDREFDKYYDWMHHGEGYLYFYYMGLAKPYILKDVQRTVKFAKMYMGDDPLAENYDKTLKLMRSPINGSKGPRFCQTAEDWQTHRTVLDNYLPPFEDIPGVPEGNACPWSDDGTYAAILEMINTRMAKGDVPLNLNATSLLTHAYMMTKEEKYKSWVLDYVTAWKNRIKANNGIVPDNVGLSGRIGENFGGKWWGGYYGWRWPHGAQTVLEPLINAGINAVLLTGDTSWLDIARGQLDMLWNLGREADGVWTVPHRHFDGGWRDYRPMDIHWPLNCWTASFEQQDLDRVLRVQSAGHIRKDVDTKIHKGNRSDNNRQWFSYINGENPGYAEAILASNLVTAAGRISEIRSDNVPIEDYDIHHWQDKNPVMLDGLVQTVMGAPQHIYHGGLMNAALRVYDEEKKRPGLPEDTGLLCGRQDSGSIEAEIQNLSATDSRSLILQAGSFGQHMFGLAEDLTTDKKMEINSKWLRVKIPPCGYIKLKLNLKRYVAPPSYDTPWRKAGSCGNLLRDRIYS